MVRGVVLQSTSFLAVDGTATAGTTTTLTDTAKDFVTLGVLVNDVLQIVDGPASGRQANITSVAATVLGFDALPEAPGLGSVYQIFRPSFVVVKGGCTVRHTPRVPVLDVPGEQGDKVQFLGRASRRVQIDGVLYSSDPVTSARDTANVAAAGTVRGWANLGTFVYLTSLTETGLKLRITDYEVTEEGGAKGLPVSILLVEVP